MKTLNEIKEEYAKEIGYSDWDTCISNHPHYKVKYLYDEVILRLLEQPLSTHHKWISVKDRLPEIRNNSYLSDGIIVCNDDGVFDDCRFTDDGRFIIHALGYDNDSYEVKNVTHWQPLPEPPKK